MELQLEFKKAQRMDGIQLAFALIIELWKLMTGNNIDRSSPKPLSPSLRREVRRLDQTMKEYWLLCENQIDSVQELVSFIEKNPQIYPFWRQIGSGYITVSAARNPKKKKNRTKQRHGKSPQN